MKRVPAIVSILAIVLLGVPAAADAAFGVTAFDVTYSQESGGAAHEAGSHDFDMTTTFSLASRVDPELGEVPEASLKNLKVKLPAGLAGNPTAVPRCSAAGFAEIPPEPPKFPNCPDDSAVGLALVRIKLIEEIGWYAAPIYNLEAPPGAPARLGFVVLGVPVTLTAGVDPRFPYNVEATASNVSQSVAIYGGQLTIWGNPPSAQHDSLRGHCVNIRERYESPADVESTGSCPFDEGAEEKAFLTLPTSCSGPSTTEYEANSWQEPADWAKGSSVTPLEVDACSNLEFEPRLQIEPTAHAAESPSGLDATIEVDPGGVLDPGRRSQSAIEKAVVTLPRGVTANPAVAAGLGGCSLAQFESETLDSAPGTGCPGNSKIGSVEVETPLLEGSVLPGSLYIAKQHDNPFGNLLTVYMVIKDPDLGILITQAGKVDPDPSTGQLTTTFDHLPPLPFSRFHLHFRTGERAPLTTPPTCGTYTTDAVLYPYAQGVAPVHLSPSFQVTGGAGGGPCPATEGQLPNAPSFTAGTIDPAAGTYSPFVLRLSRQDGSQHLGSITTTLPTGLIGKLAGIPYCSEGAIAAAEARGGEGQGAVELASPACPPASQIGTVTVGVGAGSEPLYVSGRAYLAGPYKGAPLSLEIVTPAVAGPFDLGVVAVRDALQVDPLTAQITAVSDPIPTILHGVPLDVRSIAIEMGRRDFTLNPTSCAPKSILATETSTLGAVASLNQYFQASKCNALHFKPKLSLSVSGATKRTGHPRLKAVLTTPKGAGANIAKVQVGLPHSEFLDQNNLDRVCTQPELRASKCPAKSIYGHVKAWTPLLAKPLKGPVYLGVGFGYKLPAIVADLNGQIRVLLVGKVDTTKRHGIRNTFQTVPDAPVSKFVLEMKGGRKYGLLENSENICSKPQRASVNFIAQNGLSSHSTPTIANECRAGKRGRPHR